jgi:hypothetical protein
LDLGEASFTNYEITPLNKDAKLYIDPGVYNKDTNWEGNSGNIFGNRKDQNFSPFVKIGGYTVY